MAQRVRNVIFFFICFSLSRSTCHSTLDSRPFSLDDSVCSRQNIGRNRQADLLSGLKIDDELELDRLLYRQISGFRALEDPVHVPSSSVAVAVSVGAIRDYSLDRLLGRTAPCRQFFLNRKGIDLFIRFREKSATDYEDSIGVFLGNGT